MNKLIPPGCTGPWCTGLGIGVVAGVGGGLMSLAVEGARRNHKHPGLCGQAPSDYPEIAAYLVELGIDSISLNPDTVLKTTRAIVETEKHMARGDAH